MATSTMIEFKGLTAAEMRRALRAANDYAREHNRPAHIVAWGDTWKVVDLVAPHELPLVVNVSGLPKPRKRG